LPSRLCFPVFSRSLSGLRVGSWGIVALSVLGPAHAHAYRTAGEAAGLGTGVHWSAERVRVEFSVADAPPGLDLFRSLEEASALWRPACGTVPELELVPSSAPRAAEDERNSVVWLTGAAWAEQKLEAAVPAVTELRYEKAPSGAWRIAEADILLNAEAVRWARGDVNLRSVLAHELGHLLGLAHPCGETGVPSCDADAAFADSLMHPLHSTERTAPGEDDLAGVCSLYPLASCGAEPCSGSAECSASEDCPGGQVCVEGHCSAGARELGSACTQDRTCLSRACRQGACVPSCTETANCGPNAACVAGAEGGGCVGTQRALGAECTEPTECISGHCLIEETAGRCTAACSESSPCPAGWTCGELSGSRVCIPKDKPRDRGCALAAPSTQNYSAFTLGLIATLAFALRRSPRRKALS
jgi:hypothetical protein